MLAVDSAGNAYVTGTTFSSDFPTLNAIYPNRWGGSDAYIFKLSANGQQVIYSTYLGGSSYEDGQGIAVNSNGNAYVTGRTSSSDFPKINPLYQNIRGVNDSFVFKLGANGQQAIFSTYLGGNADDVGGGIAVDGNGNAYVVGFTDSANFPTANAKFPSLRGQRDAFIAKISDSGGGGESATLTLDVLDGQDFRSGANITSDPQLLGDLGRNKGMVGAATDGEARLGVCRT